MRSPLPADCGCEYPCSCITERRNRAKDARIAELEAELAAARRSRDRLVQLQLWETSKSADAASRAVYRWGSEGWDRALRLTAAIVRHRDTPGSIMTARDAELYRALEADALESRDVPER